MSKQKINRDFLNSWPQSSAFVPKRIYKMYEKICVFIYSRIPGQYYVIKLKIYLQNQF